MLNKLLELITLDAYYKRKAINKRLRKNVVRLNTWTGVRDARSD